jgi:hypothetical protein
MILKKFKKEQNVMKQSTRKGPSEKGLRPPQ